MDSIVTTANTVGQCSTFKAAQKGEVIGQSALRSMAGRSAEQTDVYALTLRETVCSFSLEN